MFSLFDKRDILAAATKEVLEHAETITAADDLDLRSSYVKEASRIALRLFDVQKEIEENEQL
jgi:hypothetical protein